MANHPDVTVIGGGIIGLTAAYVLAKAGRRVTVLDRQEFGREASWAGAGILPPGNPARAATPADQLRAWSVSRFEAFSAELRHLTGLDNGYVRCGGVEILDAEDADVVELWRAEGLRVEQTVFPPPADTYGVADLPPQGGGVRNTSPLGGEVGSSGARTGWGAVTPPLATAYLLPDFAQVRNPWHLRALLAACERVGVTLSPNSPVQPSRLHPDRQYLLAAGAWAGEFLNYFGVELLVRPVRGQIVLFRCPRPPFARVLMHGKRYLVPRLDGRVLVGSTEEPEAGFEKANTPEGVEDLKRFAFDLCPPLRSAAVEKTWAGLRPGSPDGRPFIGPVPGVPNLFAAVGHFRAGVQLSLGTAHLVQHLLAGTTPDFPGDAFRLDRTPDATARPAFRS